MENHKFRNVIFDIGLPQEKDFLFVESVLRQRFHNLIRNELTHALDKNFGRDAQIQIDKIEIDLGKLDIQGLSSSTLVTQVSKKVVDAISAQVYNGLYLDTNDGKGLRNFSSGAEKFLVAYMHYLKTGHKPWWYVRSFAGDRPLQKWLKQISLLEIGMLMRLLMRNSLALKRWEYGTDKQSNRLLFTRFFSISLLEFDTVARGIEIYSSHASSRSWYFYFLETIALESPYKSLDPSLFYDYFRLVLAKKNHFDMAYFQSILLRLNTGPALKVALGLAQFPNTTRSGPKLKQQFLELPELLFLNEFLHSGQISYPLFYERYTTFFDVLNHLITAHRSLLKSYLFEIGYKKGALFISRFLSTHQIDKINEFLAPDSVDDTRQLVLLNELVVKKIKRKNQTEIAIRRVVAQFTLEYLIRKRGSPHVTSYFITYHLKNLSRKENIAIGVLKDRLRELLLEQKSAVSVAIRLYFGLNSKPWEHAGEHTGLLNTPNGLNSWPSVKNLFNNQKESFIKGLMPDLQVMLLVYDKLDQLLATKGEPKNKGKKLLTQLTLAYIKRHGDTAHESNRFIDFLFKSLAKVKQIDITTIKHAGRLLAEDRVVSMGNAFERYLSIPLAINRKEEVLSMPRGVKLWSSLAKELRNQRQAFAPRVVPDLNALLLLYLVLFKKLNNFMFTKSDMRKRITKITLDYFKKYGTFSYNAHHFLRHHFKMILEREEITILILEGALDDMLANNDFSIKITSLQDVGIKSTKGSGHLIAEGVRFYPLGKAINLNTLVLKYFIPKLRMQGLNPIVFQKIVLGILAATPKLSLSEQLLQRLLAAYSRKKALVQIAEGNGRRKTPSVAMPKVTLDYKTRQLIKQCVLQVFKAAEVSGLELQFYYFLEHHRDIHSGKEDAFVLLMVFLNKKLNAVSVIDVPLIARGKVQQHAFDNGLVAKGQSKKMKISHLDALRRFLSFFSTALSDDGLQQNIESTVNGDELVHAFLKDTSVEDIRREWLILMEDEAFQFNFAYQLARDFQEKLLLNISLVYKTFYKGVYEYILDFQNTTALFKLPKAHLRQHILYALSGYFLQTNKKDFSLVVAFDTFVRSLLKKRLINLEVFATLNKEAIILHSLPKEGYAIVRTYQEKFNFTMQAQRLTSPEVQAKYALLSMLGRLNEIDVNKGELGVLVSSIQSAILRNDTFLIGQLFQERELTFLFYVFPKMEARAKEILWNKLQVVLGYSMLESQIIPLVRQQVALTNIQQKDIILGIYWLGFGDWSKKSILRQLQLVSKSRIFPWLDGLLAAKKGASWNMELYVESINSQGSLPLSNTRQLALLEDVATTKGFISNPQLGISGHHKIIQLFSISNQESYMKILFDKVSQKMEWKKTFVSVFKLVLNSKKGYHIARLAHILHTFALKKNNTGEGVFLSLVHADYILSDYMMKSAVVAPYEEKPKISTAVLSDSIESEDQENVPALQMVEEYLISNGPAQKGAIRNASDLNLLLRFSLKRENSNVLELLHKLIQNRVITNRLADQLEEETLSLVFAKLLGTTRWTRLKGLLKFFRRRGQTLSRLVTLPKGTRAYLHLSLLRTWASGAMGINNAYNFYDTFLSNYFGGRYLFTLILETTVEDKPPSDLKTTVARLYQMSKLKSKALNINAKIKQEQQQEQQADDTLDTGDGFFITNAGMVLLWPFLGRYFRTLDLMDTTDFLSDEKRVRGVQLLQYLASGKTVFDDADLALNKLLCGMYLTDVVPSQLELTELEKKTSEMLLNAVLQNWEKLQGSSIAALRSSFLMREGKLEQHDDYIGLTVEKKSFDVLLTTLPWRISMIQLSSMTKRMTVLWF